jgi:hypothetical protein
MFDGIDLNHRIWLSMFDPIRAWIACAAPKAAGPRERMEIRHTSFLLKRTCYYEMSQSLEMVSNLQRNFFDLNVRHHGPQPSIFVR